MPNIRVDNRDCNPVTEIRVSHNDREITLKGREAWAIHALIQSGQRGITSVSNPAPRLAHYIFKLRGSGFDIITIDEPHGGAFAGSHARYVLRSPVSVLAVTSKLDAVAS